MTEDTPNREERKEIIFFFLVFFTLILPICRNIHNPAGRRKEKKEGREKNRRKCVEYQKSLKKRGSKYKYTEMFLSQTSD